MAYSVLRDDEIDAARLGGRNGFLQYGRVTLEPVDFQRKLEQFRQPRVRLNGQNTPVGLNRVSHNQRVVSQVCPDVYAMPSALQLTCDDHRNPGLPISIQTKMGSDVDVL